MMLDSNQDLLDLTSSFVVEGANGCGKSDLAFQRYLTALSQAAEPEEVLLLVDRASVADGIRRKIAAILRGELQSDIPIVNNANTAGWNLLQQPDRLQIHTVASLSLALVAAAPVSSGCGAGVRLTNNPDAYYMTAARAMLRTLDRDEAVAPHLETLLLHLDNDLLRAERLLGGMLRRRGELQQCLKLDEPEANRIALQTALEDAVVMTLSELVAVLPDDVARELVAIAALAGKQLAIQGSPSRITEWRKLRQLPPADAEHTTLWLALCDLLLEADGTIRQTYGVEQGFLSADSAEDENERNKRVELEGHISILAARLADLPNFAARLSAVKHVSGVRYTHLQWTVLQSLLAVLPGVMNNLSQAFRALGEMDLTEIVQGASRALDAGQAEIFGSRGIQHLVVDNAPELSFDGMRLIEGLTRSWTGDDNRSLYVTGNPYASIRRSDGAQPALFLKVLNNGVGKCVLSMRSLNLQHRSGSAIVRWINDCFGHETDAVIAEGSMPFLEARPVAEETGEVALHAIAHDNNDAPTAEARLIASLLGERRQLLDGSVAVLLGDGTSAASIVDALRQSGIACHSDTVDLLGQRSVISDLHALTRALCHLSDRVAWLAVLRAPWCGLTLEDLHRLAADTTQVAIWDLLIDEQRRSRLSDDGRQRLSRLKRVMAQTLAERGRRDLRRQVEGVWTALGGAVALQSAFEIEQTREYFRMLEDIDDGGEPDSLEALDEAVLRLCARSDESCDGVLVTTIRQAQRQTFDTVIVAGISTTIALPEDDDALRWLVRPDQFGNAQFLLAPISGEGQGDAINHWIKSLQNRMHENELRRLFYTGATRAVKSLHVIASVPYADDQWGWPAVHSPLQAMWTEIAKILPERPVELPQRAHSAGQSAIRRLPSSWLLPEAPQPKGWQALSTQARDGRLDTGLSSDDARIIVRVMQRTLAEISNQGPGDWAMRSLDGLENSFQQLFAMMGINESEVSSAADRAGQVVREMLVDEKAQWLLDVRHKKSRAPLQLTGWLDDILIDARIDRSFVDAQGTRWIIGYYFPELDGDGALDPDQLVDSQRATWNDCARLARRFDPDPVRVGLYFPYSKGWREWDPEG